MRGLGGSLTFVGLRVSRFAITGITQLGPRSARGDYKAQRLEGFGYWGFGVLS